MTKQRARRNIENGFRRDGYLSIAGVDEVGRGCLAGPVTAGAVVLEVGLRLTGICDSKQLTALARERFYGRITRGARAWAVASCSPEEIDRINIHQATLLAMHRAVSALDPPPDLVLVDAFRIPNLAIPQQPVPQGDRRCTSIAAASIVAKVTRDREMAEWHRQDPRYGYDRHKGYSTADHLAAMARFGYSPIHRRSFRPPSLFDTMDEPGVVPASIEPAE